MRSLSPPSPGLLLVHYWLPVGIGWSLAMVMRESAHLPFSLWGITLLLAGIGTAYSLDRLHPAPEAAGVRRLLWGAMLACGGLTTIAAFQMPLAVFGVAALLGAVSLFYPALKRLPLGKTLLVTGAWLWACAWFPFAATGVSPWGWMRWDAIPPLFFLMAAACILCDIQDREEDLCDCVPSLPVLLGTLSTCRVCAALALAGVLLSLQAGRYGLTAAGVVLAGLAQFPRLLERKALGPLVVDATLLLPGLLILLNGL